MEHYFIFFFLARGLNFCKYPHYDTTEVILMALLSSFGYRKSRKQRIRIGIPTPRQPLHKQTDRYRGKLHKTVLRYTFLYCRLKHTLLPSPRSRFRSHKARSCKSKRNVVVYTHKGGNPSAGGEWSGMGKRNET